MEFWKFSQSLVLWFQVREYEFSLNGNFSFDIQEHINLGIQFWRFGEWVEVLIDDRLPTRNGLTLVKHAIDAMIAQEADEVILYKNSIEFSHSWLSLLVFCIDSCPFLSIFVDFYPFSSIYRFSRIFIELHWFSSNLVNFHRFLDFYRFLSNCIDFYQISSIFIDF